METLHRYTWTQLHEGANNPLEMLQSDRTANFLQQKKSGYRLETRFSWRSGHAQLWICIAKSQETLAIFVLYIPKISASSPSVINIEGLKAVPFTLIPSLDLVMHVYRFQKHLLDLKQMIVVLQMHHNSLI